MLVRRGFELLNILLNKTPNQLNRVVDDISDREVIIVKSKNKIRASKDFMDIFETIETFNLQNPRDYIINPSYILDISNNIEVLAEDYDIAVKYGEDNDLKRIYLILFGLAVVCSNENKKATEVIKESMTNLYKKEFKLKYMLNKIIGREKHCYAIYLKHFPVSLMALLLNKPVGLLEEQIIDKIYEGEL